METKTVGKILGNVVVEALADTSPDTLSQVVAKTIADTLTCVEATSKTEGDTVAALHAIKRCRPKQLVKLRAKWKPRQCLTSCLTS